MSDGRKFNVIASIDGKMVQIIYIHIIGNDECTSWFGNCLAFRRDLSGKSGEFFEVKPDMEGSYKTGDRIGRISFGDIVLPEDERYLDYIRTSTPATQYSIEVLKDVKAK